MKIKHMDGFEIRNTMDADFGVIGSHKTYPYIKRGEIWFDERYKKEKSHFLKVHLYELKLLNKMPYEKARKFVKKKFIQKNKVGRIPKYITKVGQYRGFKVKYVDGRIIRQFLDPKFILGQHGFLRKDIGKKEIWIDIRQDKREYKYTLIHEYKEAILMRKGMEYNDAHDYAIAAEKAARRKDGHAHYYKD
ncbi:MAG: hypothetical protein ABIE22_04700 [archaeon]